MVAVKRHGLALRVAAKPLEADREVVMAAVTQYAGAVDVDVIVHVVVLLASVVDDDDIVR